MMTILIADFDNTLDDALNGVTEAGAALGRMYRAALARAEAAAAEAAEARATNEALAELAASETERRVALAERVAELEAQLEEATQLLSIAIDRLPEEEQEIVALRWALSGTFTNELPTIAAPAAATLNGRKPTPEAA